MQNAGVPDPVAGANTGPAKRMRRPSVRLHQPYYENPGHRKLQRQWKAMKKELEAGKKVPTAKTADAKRKKPGGQSDSSKGVMEGLNSDDDVAIGNWKNFNADSRERDFKRKRVRPSSAKKWISVKSRENEDHEIEKVLVSSSKSEGPEEGEGKGERQGGEGNLEANGVYSNLVIENSLPYSPDRSFGSDDLSGKLMDGADKNVEGKGLKQRVLRNSRGSNDTRAELRARDGESDERNGVRLWLNQLGLGKYAPMFKIHEVDDEVLPFLTLEDLKDMGIKAVGPRRKMYSSIEKLGKGFQ